jgi:N-acetylmuramoyl-L-alanine amidase
LRASFVLLFVLLAMIGCKGDDSREKKGSSPVGVERLSELEGKAVGWLSPATLLPNRAEVVALSDELAVGAARLGPDAWALRLSRRSAELRVRLWRVLHSDADAREAIEIFASIVKGALAQGAADEGCQAAFAHALLTSEQARDPALLYRQLYSSAKLFAGSVCEPQFADALSAIASYRPGKEVLAALDQEVEAKRPKIAPTTAPSSSAPAAAAAAVSSDEAGVVVTPKVTSGAAVRVVAIEPYGSRDRARVVVTLSGPATYRVGELTGPRLFVDLEHTEPSPRHEVQVGGLVERVRQSRAGDVVAAARGNEPVTRIVLDLSGKAYRRIFYLPEPFRVVIDVATHLPSQASYAAGSARVVSRVALDAGHGGSDPGATGPSGLREKDITLEIAHLAAPVLSRELGIPTLLTRDDDRLVPLDERAARANAFHADLFVSIHCNASENGAAHGVMSFVLDTTKDDLAARIAARENATSLAATSQVASIASSLRLADLGTRSTHFAELLQRSAMGSLAGRFGDASDQGVKTAGFLVLLGAEMPSVLFETSFISNAAEEKRLATADYRQKIADAIVNAVRAYREGR